MNKWKIHRDSYYSELYNRFGYDYIEEAGFFFDTDPINRDISESINLLCTPINFLKGFNPLLKNCVLLTTGSFCPIHFGHIKMMEIAKAAAEKEGFNVLGAYISPSHDEYVNYKTKGWLNSYERIKLILDEIKRHRLDWVTVDPWESTFNKVAVNFTDVIERLDLYLKKHIGEKIHILYVCGGDNIRFSKTFTLKGHCIVVNRPGHDQYLKPINNRILIADGNSDISSTEIRNSATYCNDTAKRALIRTNDSYAEKLVIDKLRSQFDNYSIQSIRSQKQVLTRLLSKKDYPIISLDIEMSYPYSLDISRYYDLFGANKLTYGPRPDSPELSDQIDKILDSISARECILYDDDIHTGGTVRFVKNALKIKGIETKAIVSLTISDQKEEIIDAKDFLFGLDPTAGLVIPLPENLVRLPYLYPYVCPYLRSSIKDPLKFSYEMWLLNKKIHDKTKLLLRDVDYLQKWCLYVGYEINTSLSQICEDHANKLKEFL